MARTMGDGVNPAGIPSGVDLVAGYIDGPKSKWPASGWARWSHVSQLHISVLGDLDAQAFDVEHGNAPADQVAGACRYRATHGLWSVWYTNEAMVDGARAALHAVGLDFQSATLWPRAGVYLWAADPTGVEHLRPAWAPVAPVACQWKWAADYDLSAVDDRFLAATAPVHNTTSAQPPATPPASPQEGSDMPRLFAATSDSHATEGTVNRHPIVPKGTVVIVFDNGKVAHVEEPADIAGLEAAWGTKVQSVSGDTIVNVLRGTP